MNFFTLLKQEHKEAKDTFKKLLKADKIDRKETQTLCYKLLLHMEMEESYFYPEMEKYKVSKDLSEEANLEHDEAKAFIDALLTSKLDEMAYKVKLEMLQLCIEHHADEEEDELFPVAQKKLSDAQISAITDKMMALKDKKQKILVAQQ
jgi:hemerythrin-like domain-containing protein